MKHKHFELITRWVNDIDLVILIKPCTQGAWLRSKWQSTPSWDNDCNYFLVPECHVEVALAWLNGETLQCLYQGTWCDAAPLRDKAYIFTPENEYRIKPKTKQVRVWVGTRDSNFILLKKEPSETVRDNYLWTEVMVEQEV